ncbi:LacI family DNA-binding transcriptional regulator [Enterocloster clostridioformis]|uniref:LacI family DNA-binding transcriptional regulator n=1 Tax=Enterocloster clostridioformis TaxID=1531 RepID=UPI0026765FDF|nr:LacI family DNA-binding transcriptional regulator [Enterocloster clostridioformis]
MAKEIKLSDIAERLNVSTVTVSKALSGQRGVSEQLREKITNLAEEMGYKKVQKAKNEKQNYTIGVIVAERYLKENQSFYWTIYQEISQRAITRKCFTMLEVISYEDEKSIECPKIITEEKVEGLIIMGAFKNEYAYMLMDTVTVPRINLDTTVAADMCDAVVSNNMLGGYQMTNYLLKMGHRKIGFVGTRLTTSSIDDRYLGYLKALMEHGIPWKEEWIIDDRDREYGRVDCDTKFQLPLGDMPTAFFCNCDLSASILIKKLADKGYSVPGDISVAGFDNYVIDQFGTVGITTYEINTKEMASRVVHIMLCKLENSRYTTGMFMLPGRFIERDSVRQVGMPVPFV